MSFCPSCRSEFRPGFDRCEECDVALVESIPELAERPGVPNPAFQTVYTTTELVDAVSIKVLLEGRGIEAEVQNNYAGFSAIEMPTSAAPFLIAVPAGNAAEAVKVLQETQGIRSNRPTTNRGMWWVAAVLVGGPIILVLVAGLFELLSGG